MKTGNFVLHKNKGSGFSGKIKRRGHAGLHPGLAAVAGAHQQLAHPLDHSPSAPCSHTQPVRLVAIPGLPSESAVSELGALAPAGRHEARGRNVGHNGPQPLFRGLASSLEHVSQDEDALFLLCWSREGAKGSGVWGLTEHQPVSPWGAGLGSTPLGTGNPGCFRLEIAQPPQGRDSLDIYHLT